MVWRWDSDAFGIGVANQDPDGDTNLVNIRLRLPGQYLDEETGLHYNYFRDYDSLLGRYVESDPIGLQGGENTYAYANNAPPSIVDPKGLQAGPGLGDQFNPGGWRGDGTRDYTAYFDSRFPKTISGARALLMKRIAERICAMMFSATVPGMSGGADDIDIAPDMSRFGDAPQTWYERNVALGAFQIKTEPIAVEWEQGCSRCYKYSTSMYVEENTGSNYWLLKPLFQERTVRMASWPMTGSGCCSD